MCRACAGMDAQEKRTFLGEVKNAAYAVNRGIQKSFREMEQGWNAKDDFAIGTVLPENQKPEPAPKRTPKEPKRDTQER